MPTKHYQHTLWYQKILQHEQAGWDWMQGHIPKIDLDAKHETTSFVQACINNRKDTVKVNNINLKYVFYDVYFVFVFCILVMYDNQ